MKSIGPKISDRHHKMLRSLTQFFEGQRPAIERAIEDAFNRYIDISDMARLMSGESVPCAACGKLISKDDAWHAGIYSEVYHAICSDELANA